MTTSTSRPAIRSTRSTGASSAIFAAEPRVGVLECSRRLGVARGTVQARLERLARDGVIRGWGPELDSAAMGYTVTAFATLEIRQASPDRPGHDAVAAHLATIPQVLEVHTITGAGDMFARIVARSNADLQRVIDRVVDFEGVVRTSTVIALATQIPYGVQPLVRLAGADERPEPPESRRVGQNRRKGPARRVDGGHAQTRCWARRCRTSPVLQTMPSQPEGASDAPSHRACPPVGPGGRAGRRVARRCRRPAPAPRRTGHISRLDGDERRGHAAVGQPTRSSTTTSRCDPPSRHSARTSRGWSPTPRPDRCCGATHRSSTSCRRRTPSSSPRSTR